MEWVFVVLIRLAVPLLILRWNLFGSILAIIADNLDVVILDFLGVKEFAPYNRVDKFLDTYFYLIAGYTIWFWKNQFAKRVGIFLLVYRLIGVMIYELTDLRFLLFVFRTYLYFSICTTLYSRRCLRKSRLLIGFRHCRL